MADGAGTECHKVRSSAVSSSNVRNELTVMKDDDWLRADIETTNLLNRLLGDLELRRIVETSIPKDQRQPDWWAMTCGMLAGFPRAVVSEDPGNVRFRNKKLVDAIARLSSAADEFEQAAGCSLLTVNEALHPSPETPEWGLNAKGLNSFDLRNLPTVSIFDYLEMIRQRIEDGSYELGVHPLVATPSGQTPRHNASAAAWFAVRALEVMQAQHGPRFVEAAAACASMLCNEHVDPETIKSMLQNRISSQARDIQRAR